MLGHIIALALSKFLTWQECWNCGCTVSHSPLLFNLFVIYKLTSIYLLFAPTTSKLSFKWIIIQGYKLLSFKGISKILGKHTHVTLQILFTK